jgi:hypothetical protein
MALKPARLSSEIKYKYMGSNNWLGTTQFESSCT